MWWSRSRSPFRALLVSALLLGLAGCGFRPMYGKSSVDPAVAEELASISISPIPERQGQLLHNALLNSLNPKGEPAKAQYVLAVILSATDSQEALLKDNTASRNLVTYTARFQLYSGDVRIAAGNVTKQLSYDFLEQHYADISAQDDVQRRAATVVAEEIRNDLSAYFIRSAEVKQGIVKPVR